MSADLDLLARARAASRLAIRDKGGIPGIDPADLGLGAAWLLARNHPRSSDSAIAKRMANGVKRAGWGTRGLDIELQIPGDALEPATYLSALEAAELRLARDPRVLGRAQRSADLEPRHGRAQELARARAISVRRAQQVLKKQRGDLDQGQGDLFDGSSEP